MRSCCPPSAGTVRVSAAPGPLTNCCAAGRPSHWAPPAAPNRRGTPPPAAGVELRAPLSWGELNTALGTDPPIDDTATPIDDTGTPIEADIPIETGMPIDTAAPIDDTGIPIDDTGIPIDETDIPIDEMGMFIDETGIPTDEADIPMDETDMPIDETGMPIDEAGIPIDEIDMPIDETRTSAAAGALALMDTVAPIGCCSELAMDMAASGEPDRRLIELVMVPASRPPSIEPCCDMEPKPAGLETAPGGDCRPPSCCCLLASICCSWPESTEPLTTPGEPYCE